MAIEQQRLQPHPHQSTAKTRDDRKQRWFSLSLFGILCLIVFMQIYLGILLLEQSDWRMVYQLSRRLCPTRVHWRTFMANITLVSVRYCEAYYYLTNHHT